MNNAKAPRHTYPILDALRFLAATLVILLHLVGSNQSDALWTKFFPSATNLSGVYSGVDSFFFIGFIGVQIFFSISGYIIFMSAEKSVSVLEFFEKRLLRILPALWLSASVGAILYLAFDLFSVREIIFMIVKSFLLAPFGPYIDDVIWTIIVEMAFYVGICVAMIVVGRDKLRYFAYYLIVSSTLYWLALTVFPALAGNTLLMQLSRRLLFEHGAFFGAGMLLFPSTNNGGKNWVKLLFFTIALVPTILQIDNSVQYIYASKSGRGASDSTVLPILIYLASLMLIYLSKFPLVERFHLGNAKFYRSVGLMTYPLYLLHYIVGNFIYAIIFKFLHLPISATTVLTVFIVMIISFRVSNTIEPALRRAMEPYLSGIFSSLRAAVVFGRT